MDEEALKKQALQKLLSDNDAVSKQLLQTTHQFPDTQRTANSPSDVIDSYVGAPVRAGLAAASDEQSKSEGSFLSAAPLQAGWQAIKNQFGNDPNNAPTGKTVAEKIGFTGVPLSQLPVTQNLYRQPNEPTEAFDIRPQAGGTLDPSPAGIAGFGVEASTDPLMYSGNLAKKGLAGVSGTVESIKGAPFQRTKQMFQVGQVQFPATNTAEALKIKKILEDTGKVNSQTNVLRKLTD